MKKLIVRLSSLGDVILSSVALEASGPWDWVVRTEYSDLLQGHSNLNRIWKFNRTSGRLSGFLHWVSLCRQIWSEHYDEIYDLHRTQRTLLMKILFRAWDLSALVRRRLKSSGGSGNGGSESLGFPRVRWKTISKQRFRMYGYFVFKKVWPVALRPTPWVEKFQVLVGLSGHLTPNLRHLVHLKQDSQNVPKIDLNLQQGERAKALPESLIGAISHWKSTCAPNMKTLGYVCVMPSSKWASKQWPTNHYVSLFSSIQASTVAADILDSSDELLGSFSAGLLGPVFLPVILGTKGDLASRELVEALEENEIPHFSGVGLWDLKTTAKVLAGSQGYLGCDTGMAHLAQAVGVGATILYGPTTPDVGFAVAGPALNAVGTSLGCRPCSKDGRWCYRFSERYECLKGLKPKVVQNSLMSFVVASRAGVPTMNGDQSLLGVQGESND